MRNIIVGLAMLVLMPSLSYTAGEDEDIQALLGLKTPPDGVVFEIVSSEPDWLKVAIPRVKKHIAKLRRRFPALQIAVVTHGDEQFALTTHNQNQYDQLHKEIRSLTQDSGIPVHVCGAYASWKNVSPEEFPDYVDVSATGPAEIRQYEEFGFKKIVISD
jgi:intracellular sulfur oxidation DsrE/DsrF family protein